MKLRRMITVATFAFSVWRAYNNMRKGTRQTLIRAAKRI